MPADRPSRRRGALRRGIAPLLVVALLGVGLPAPALAEGTEWSPVLSAEEKPGVPRLPVQFNLPQLVTTPDPADLDFATVQLEVPATPDTAEYSVVSDQEIRTAEGIWQVTGDGTVVYTPAPESDTDAPPIAFTVERSSDGDRSSPAQLDAEYPDVVDHEPRSAQGRSVTVDLLAGSSNIRPGTVRLLVDGLPAGSSATLDGRQVVVSGQGTWTLGEDGSQVTWEPRRDHRGDIAPLRYSGADAAGQYAAPAEIRLEVPSIEHLSATAPFGEPVVFDLAAATEAIAPESLELAAVGGAGDAADTGSGARLSVPGQGTWSLDREAMTLTFRPASAEVRYVTPVQLTGRSPSGHASLPSNVEIAYPELVDQYAAANPGNPIRFDPLVSSRFVAGETLRLAPAGQPSGAAPSADGSQMTVPGQGLWVVDAEAGTVEFRPGTDPSTGEVFTGTPDPALVMADDRAGSNTATSRLVAQYAAAVPTARTDQVVTDPNTPVRLDLLANDQPGSASTTLVPSSIELQSVAARNDSGGTSLYLPGQGTFDVDSGGILTYVPDEDFAGTTSTVSYTVEDSQGITVSSSLAVTVRDEAAGAATEEPAAPAGVADLVAPLRDPSSDPFLLYVTIMLLLGFAGGAAVVVSRYLAAEERRLREA